MSNLGMKVMINMLDDKDRKTAGTIAASLGKLITSASFDSDGNECHGSLILRFDDGTGIRIYDDGQSCCESRYMDTDDDVISLVGCRLSNIETIDGPGEDDGNEYHDTEFLRVKTDKGDITIVNHNEHNGYYGGFSMRVDLLGSGHE